MSLIEDGKGFPAAQSSPLTPDRQRSHREMPGSSEARAGSLKSDTRMLMVYARRVAERIMRPIDAFLDQYADGMVALMTLVIVGVAALAAFGIKLEVLLLALHLLFS